MKVLLVGIKKKKDLKRLNKRETNFIEQEKAKNSFENKQEMFKESKQLIWNQNRKPTKITKLGLKKDWSTKY